MFRFTFALADPREMAVLVSLNYAINYATELGGRPGELVVVAEQIKSGH
jgi:hypothetical protein